jgi:hypothetical protein
MIIGGNWIMGAVVIPNTGTRPTKLQTQNWFLDKLVEDINSIAIMNELVKAVVDGYLRQEDTTVIINKAHAQRMAKLLVGANISTMQYNHKYGGEYEERPPLGWGQ